MRIGCCVSSQESIQAAEDAGFDYFEPAVSIVKPESSDADFEPVYEMLSSFDIVPEAWNCLLPGDMKVVGPEVDFYRLERYLRTAFERIGELGGEIVVLGSSETRRIPDGFDRSKAVDQYMEFLALCGQISGPNGITVALEPLNSTETNFINTVPEALDIIQKVDHPFVKLTVDYYHMMSSGDALDVISKASDEIVHAHVADTGRVYPGGGNWPIVEFIEALKNCEYEDRVSVECGWGNFSVECAKTYDYLRRLI